MPSVTWYPKKVKRKRINCPVCRDTHQVKDKITGELRSCVLCAVRADSK